MALGRVNGKAIVEAQLHMPRIGAWTADLVVDAENASQVTGAIAFDLGGTLKYRGTATRAGSAFGSVSLRVVGGNAGLPVNLAPKSYEGVPLRIPLQDAITDAGEQLSSTIAPALLTVQLAKWTRFNETCTSVLDTLSAEAGCIWRVLYDGTVWLGNDAYPEIPVPHELLSGDPHQGRVEIGVDAPALVPGVKFLGRNVEQVDHVLTESKVRTVVHFE